MTTATTWEQTALVDDLLTAIESDPRSIDARILLIEQYEALGWDDAAANEARTVIELFPDSEATNTLLWRYNSQDATEKEEKKARKKQKQARKPVTSVGSSQHSAFDVQQLGVEYLVLQDDAKLMLRELSVLAELAPEIDCAERLAELRAPSEGRMFSAAKGKAAFLATSPTATYNKAGAFKSARGVATSMKADRKRALDLAISDLEAVEERQGSTYQTEKDKDTVRDTLRKRADAVKSALPADLAHLPLDALMHVEHERLGREYQNSETMLGDPIEDIPRADFWVSGDGYAWDMDELVQAIQANKGAMRNPLTKEIFSTDDVAAIIRHPKGKPLAALEVKQSQLRKGVRPQTVTMLRTLSTTLLHDMSETCQPSYEAVDTFLLYVATLPAAEQEAIEKLRVAAVDSHSGQAFDDTVGEAVTDAKGNRLCFYKAGDFFRQAADALGKT